MSCEDRANGAVQGIIIVIVLFFVILFVTLAQSAPPDAPGYDDDPALPVDLPSAEDSRDPRGARHPSAGPPPAKYMTDLALHITSGDTLGGPVASYRLALVDAPELGEPGHSEAAAYLESVCPPGTPLVIDVDGRQHYDQRGRIVAAVWCGEAAVQAAAAGDADGLGPSANELLLRTGHACLLADYLDRSEFGRADWARTSVIPCGAP